MRIVSIVIIILLAVVSGLYVWSLAPGSWASKSDQPSKPASKKTVYYYLDSTDAVIFADRMEDIPLERRATAKTMEVSPKIALAGRHDVNPLVGASSDKPKGPDIVIYTTAWCGYCKRAKKDLDAWGMKYREFDVEKDPNAAAECMNRYGGRGVPVVVIDGQAVNGYSYDRMKELLSKYL